MARQPAPFIQTPPLPGAFARGVGGQGAKEKRGQLNRDDSDGLAHSFQFRGAGSVNYLAFMFPGIVAMSVLFTSVFSAMSFVWDFKEVLVSPVPRAAIAVGKALGGATIAVVQGAVILVLGPVVGIPLRSGTYFGMLGVLSLLALALNGLGILVASRMRLMQGFPVGMNFLVMPLLCFSDALHPPRACRRRLRL